MSYPSEKGKIGLIIIGDLLKWKNDIIVMDDLPRKMVRAQRHNQKEVGLENALPPSK